MKGLRFTALALMSIFLCCGCDWFGGGDKEKQYDKVMILYSAGFNSLSSDLQDDIQEIMAGDVPYQSSDKAIIVVSHSTAAYKSYDVKTKPSIVQIYKTKKQGTVSDTLTFLSEDDILTKKEVLTKTLNYIASEFKSDSYGLIVSSHGTGWLPAGYYTESDESVISFSSGKIKRQAAKYELPDGAIRYSDRDSVPGPRVKSIMEEVSGPRYALISYETEIQDFADAIPFHLDYLLFDVCLMGGIEVAYQLKDKSTWLGFSPTEIMSDGFDYRKVTSRLLRDGSPDLNGLADDYLALYEKKSGDSRSATFSIVKTDGLEPLAQTCKSLFEKYESQIDTLNYHDVQPFYRSYHHWYFDMEDILIKAGVSTDDLSNFRTKLKNCVSHEVHTEWFMPASGGFFIKNCCGLSMYLPGSGSDRFDEAYKKLEWNKATSLVRQ